MASLDGPIKKRAVLYTRDNGIYRWLNFAITTTRIGAMVEPFHMDDRTGYSDYDASDPMVRVDDLQNIAPGMEFALMSPDGQPLHGGDLLPRVFKRAGNFDPV